MQSGDAALPQSLGMGGERLMQWFPEILVNTEGPFTPTAPKLNLRIKTHCKGGQQTQESHEPQVQLYL